MYKIFVESGNIKAKYALSLFLSLKCARQVEALNLLDFVMKQANLDDFGGLILYIRYVEILVRKILTFSLVKAYKGEDIRDLLHEKLEESIKVNKLRADLTRHVPNKQLTDYLLHEVLRKQIDVKGDAFVKPFVLVFKQKINNMLNDKQKEKLRSSELAMRQTLTQLWTDLQNYWKLYILLKNWISLTTICSPCHIKY